MPKKNGYRLVQIETFEDEKIKLMGLVQTDSI